MNSWVTSRIFEDYLTQLNRHIDVKIKNPAFLLSICHLFKEHKVSQEYKGCFFPLYQLATAFGFGDHPCLHVQL